MMHGRGVTLFCFIYRARVNRIRDKEKKQAHDDRHWTHKDLDEMTERDWRIFKEDFGISCKGNEFHSILRILSRLRKVDENGPAFGR